jgi:hypothetical protein
MDVNALNRLSLLVLLILELVSLLCAYDFQCLTCDNLVDGPGCGEFTIQIPVQTCRTFCYFAIVHNRSSLSTSATVKRDLASVTLTRAIRDCSPYEDMSVEGHLLLESKLGSLSSMIDIITLKRCNSEQCNNDFYLKTDEMLLLGRSSFSRFCSFPLLLSVATVIFYWKSMF